MPRQDFLAFILNRQGLVASISLVRQFCMTDGQNRSLNPALHKWACGKYMYSALHSQKSNSHTIPSHSHTHYSPTYTLSPIHTHWGPPVAAVDVEDLAIEGTVNAQVEILQCQNSPRSILGNCWHLISLPCEIPLERGEDWGGKRE